jgi:hypothetical protein
VAPVVPDGVVRVGEDWRYTEWAQGGHVEQIGADPPATARDPQAEPAAVAASAARPGLDPTQRPAAPGP